jgi:hypothetical protein
MNPPDRREDRPGVWMKTWESWAWDEEVARRLRETVVPISSYHPLQRHPPTGASKKYERVQSNRRMRRHVNSLLRSGPFGDDWGCHFPGRRDFFDWRSVY